MFEMPMLLAGLAAAAIPIIIHLLHRQRTRPINWGAMMFLQESAVLQKRRRNIEHWLLLLLRVALLALLALALARYIFEIALAHQRRVQPERVGWPLQAVESRPAGKGKGHFIIRHDLQEYDFVSAMAKVMKCLYELFRIVK